MMEEEYKTHKQNFSLSKTRKVQFIKIVRPYWTETQRQALSIYLAAFLAKKGVPWSGTEELILELSDKSDDEETKQRMAAIKKTFEKVQEGDKIKGYSGLSEILSKTDLDSFSKLFKNKGKKEKPQKGGQAERLVALVEKQNVKLFQDECGEPYARFQVKDHFEIWKEKSKEFKGWLLRKFWKTEEKAPNSYAFNAALNVLEAKARFEGEMYKLHVRVAWHDGAIWYDLGNWQAVKITASGWEIVVDPPILFKRYPHQRAQVIPEDCGQDDIFELFKFLNIRKEEQLLFIASLVCALIPDIPHPLDGLHGVQGTAKTTGLKIKKELIDPSELRILTPPNNIAEFVQMASHHYYIPFDNLTSMPEWLSDALCRACTGEGFSKRELYTDDDDVIYSFIRCVGVAGINVIPQKADLLDRCLPFELDLIPQEARKDEKEFFDEFNRVKPRILGAMFTLLSKAMKEYPNVNLRRKPRMADFAKWGCAISIGLGKSEDDFVEAYSSNINIQNEEAIEANPVARAIIVFMENREEWQGSPTDLLKDINVIARNLGLDTTDKKFPKDPKWLWRRIQEIKSNLLTVGISIRRDDSNHSDGRKISLKRIIETQQTKDKKDNTDINDISDVRSKYPKSMNFGQQDITDINLYLLSPNIDSKEEEEILEKEREDNEEIEKNDVRVDMMSECKRNQGLATDNIETDVVLTIEDMSYLAFDFTLPEAEFLSLSREIEGNGHTLGRRKFLEKLSVFKHLSGARAS
ncbi:MAG: hypothetical protein ACREOW_10510 [Thermodesulfobacteriota bacterium]